MCLIDALSGRSVVTAAPRHLRTGKRGEEDADLHLRELGYVVVARNWRSPRQKGEVDLIAWDDDVLCFVEVKTRTTRDVKPAEAAVDTKKQRELRLMAREYLRRLARRRNTRRWLRESNGAFARAGDQIPLYRFDVVSVYYDSPAGKVTDITLFKNAFRLS
ncbi:MAG TPA: YraN family protein [Terriglobales bacterium]|nr:YraN family protein [Terriglobales bacterium]